jgi:hypothetical protein
MPKTLTQRRCVHPNAKRVHEEHKPMLVTERESRAEGAEDGKEEVEFHNLTINGSGVVHGSRSTGRTGIRIRMKMKRGNMGRIGNDDGELSFPESFPNSGIKLFHQRLRAPKGAKANSRDKRGLLIPFFHTVPLP